jgi:glucose/arabinose dehydrogenase
MTPFRHLSPALSLATLLLAGGAGLADAQQRPPCAPDNGGITLPQGFCAVLVGENLGPVRHLAVAPNGDIWAARRGQEGGLVQLRDTTGDGRMDVVRRVFANPGGGSGIAIVGDALYYAPDDRVLRFPWPQGQAAPDTTPQIIVRGLPVGGHSAKGIVIGRDGALYVSLGSLTNSCQQRDRQNTSAGHQPCHELEQRAGVWKFDSRREGQHAHLEARFATGLRNAMALSMEPTTGTLHAAVHGRDQYAANWGWPELESQENPAEEFFALQQGSNGGWPYCYFDPRKQQKLQNPEYGGDRQKVGDCGRAAMPVLAFPAHWAPNASLFYTGTQFPTSHRSGVFIAFHGSWNRAPAPQQGFRVVFAPFQNGKTAGTYDTFAAPAGDPTSIRFSGLAVGPDGSLYIGADAQGKVWRVMAR